MCEIPGHRLKGCDLHKQEPCPSPGAKLFDPYNRLDRLQKLAHLGNNVQFWSALFVVLSGALTIAVKGFDVDPWWSPVCWLLCAVLLVESIVWRRQHRGKT